MLPLFQFLRKLIISILNFLLRIYSIVFFIFICVFIYKKYIRQEYSIVFSDMQTSFAIPKKCYSLKYTLSEIEEKFPGFSWPSCPTCGYAHSFSEPEGHRSRDNLCKYTWGYFLRLLDIEDKKSCDYYSKKDGSELKSPLFELLPPKGTYLIDDKFYEINETSWSFVAGAGRDLYVYKLKDPNKSILLLQEEDFSPFSITSIKQTQIITLPFGTYLIKIKSDVHEERYVISVQKK